MAQQTKMEWNVNDPKTIGNYIVDMGAWGVSLGWWDGKGWVEMWNSDTIHVYGWIEIPKYS